MKKKMLGVFTVVICFVTIVMSFAFAYESREEAPIDMARYDHTSFISAELSIERQLRFDSKGKKMVVGLQSRRGRVKTITGLAMQAGR